MNLRQIPLKGINIDKQVPMTTSKHIETNAARVRTRL